MANIYRKAALDKLSSPEQLDKAITIISPSFWIAAIGIAAIVVIAFIWSVFGRLPVSVTTDGIYMGPDGIRTVASETSGFVDEVYVANGDKVIAGQQLAHIDTTAAEEELEALLKRREGVALVTFDSENDAATADNKSLLDIKAQKIVSNASLTTNQSVLESREKELEEQKEATEKAKKEYEAAREEYLDSMDVSDNSAQQIAYQDAQSQLSASKSYYESAKSSLTQAQATASSLQSQKSDLESAIDQLKDTYQQAQTAMQTANAEMISAQTAQQTAQAQLAGATTDEERQAAQTAYDEASAAYNAAQEKYTEASNTAAVTENQLSGYQTQLSGIQTQIDTNKAQLGTTSASVDEWYAGVAQAQEDYNAAEDAYIAAMSASAAQQGNTSKQGAAYNVALQNYTTELSTRRSLEDSVLQLMAQLAADQTNLDNQNAALKLQFSSARAGILDQLDQEIAKQQKLIDNATIRSNRDGFVAGMNIAVGNPVQQGSTVCRISSDQQQDQVIICYAAVTEGRKIKPGMEVMVYPSTVNRQEYGHIDASVLEVSDYVISSEEMANQIGDSSLVQMFQQSGPVVRVLCELKTDETTASGYHWSSKKGADVEIAEGTIVSADVVTENKAPISMLVPYLKEKFTVKRNDNTQSGQSAQQGGY